MTAATEVAVAAGAGWPRPGRSHSRSRLDHHDDPSRGEAGCFLTPDESVVVFDVADLLESVWERRNTLSTVGPTLLPSIDPGCIGRASRERRL